MAEDAERLSRYMGFDEETVQKMYLAGALHDIGKVAVGNEILEKPGRLTEDEFAVMKHHAAYTYYILSGVDDFDEIRDWAAFHHERLDGTGYPFGKTAAELNTQERMMACIDIYQALTESRPYKQGMPHGRLLTGSNIPLFLILITLSFYFLALNCTGYHALDNVLLTGQIEDDNRNHGQYQQCHHGTQILCTVRTYQALYYNRYGLVISTQADHQIRQQVVVPDPHGIQDGYGDGSRL